MADCPFCLISSGKIKALTVYEDDFCKAFLDINPGTKGQVVLIPKRHVEGIHALTPSEVNKLFNAARIIIIGMTQSLSCEGVNLIYSLGPRAGQRSEHMLLYLIPRYPDDKVVIVWEPKQANPNDLMKIQQSLTSAIKSVPKIIENPKPKIIEENDDEGDVEVIEEKPRVPIY